MLPQLSVIVPCFNEEASLPLLAERLGPVVIAAFDGRAEVVAVDDGSTDRTWAVLEQLTINYPFMYALRHDKNCGLAEAWHTGAGAARADVVCTLDADLQYRPEEIHKLFRVWAESGADIVQGARVRPTRRSDLRYLLSRGLNSLLNGLFGMSLEDNKSGFLICRREVFLELLETRGEFRYFQALVMVAAHKRGLSFCSVATPFDERAAGRSFLGEFPFSVSAAVAADLCRAFVRYRLKKA